MEQVDSIPPEAMSCPSMVLRGLANSRVADLVERAVLSRRRAPNPLHKKQTEPMISSLHRPELSSHRYLGNSIGADVKH